jgi:hypothetical protein
MASIFLLLIRPGSQSPAALTPPIAQHAPSVRGGHSFSKTMFIQTFPAMRLVCSFHESPPNINDAGHVRPSEVVKETTLEPQCQESLRIQNR